VCGEVPPGKKEEGKVNAHEPPILLRCDGQKGERGVPPEKLLRLKAARKEKLPSKGEKES